MLDLFHNGSMLFADKEARVINFLPAAHDAFESYMFTFSSQKVPPLYSRGGKQTIKQTFCFLLMGHLNGLPQNTTKG